MDGQKDSKVVNIGRSKVDVAIEDRDTKEKKKTDSTLGSI
jgi:hypothetical protein